MKASKIVLAGAALIASTMTLTACDVLDQVIDVVGENQQRPASAEHSYQVDDPEFVEPSTESKVTALTKERAAKSLETLPSIGSISEDDLSMCVDESTGTGCYGDDSFIFWEKIADLDNWDYIIEGASCNARQAVLIRDSVDPDTEIDGQCNVTKGEWVDPYGANRSFDGMDISGLGDATTDPKQMDIDHIVSRSWAWKHGARNWDENKRTEFANDPDNLIAVGASSNRSKGDLGVDAWVPFSPEHACRILDSTVEIAAEYDLPFTYDERTIIERDLKRCVNEESPFFWEVEDGRLVRS